MNSADILMWIDVVGLRALGLNSPQVASHEDKQHRDQHVQITSGLRMKPAFLCSEIIIGLRTKPSNGERKHVWAEIAGAPLWS